MPRKRPRAGLFVCVEDFRDAFGQSQVRVADDAGDRRALACCRGCGGLGHELRLAHAAQVLRPVLAVAGPALDEDRLLDVVAPAVRPFGLRVAPEVVEQVVTGRPTPEMMVRIDDPAGRGDRGFLDLGKPLGRAGLGC